MPKCLKCGMDLPEEARFCFSCGTPLDDSTARTRRRRQRGNGAGSARKRGNTWTAVYIDRWYMLGDHMVPHQITKGGFPNKTAALAYVPELKKLANKIAANTTADVVEPGTVAALYETFENGHMKELSKSKQTAYKIAYGRMDELKKRYMESLTIDDLQSTVNKNASTHYPAKDMRDLLSNLYNLAMAQRLVTINLARFIVLPELVEKEQVPFYKDEITTLWKDYEAGNTFTGYILLMCYSGMMPGELMEAKKENIDWERQEIMGCGLKTKRRKKTPIVVADFMLPVLQALCDYSKSDKLLCMNKDNFYKTYYATLNRVGIEKKTPYSCRHTTATELVLDETSLLVVKKIMRHSNLASTQRYAHMDTAPMLEALNQLIPKSEEENEEASAGQCY